MKEITIERVTLVKIKSKFIIDFCKWLKEKILLRFVSFRTEYDQTQTSLQNPVATYADAQHRSSLPVTFNLNPDEQSQSGPIPLG